MNTATTAFNSDLIASEVSEPEFDDQEQAERYDVWFRAQVQAALNHDQDYLPHAAAMTEVDRMLAEKRAMHVTD